MDEEEETVLEPEEVHPAALLRATFERDLSRVKRLIAAGVSLEAVDPNGNTPFLIAVNTGSVDIVKELVAAGAKLDVRSRIMGDPVAQSVFFGGDEMLALVKSLGVQFADPLLELAYAGDLEKLKLHDRERVANAKDSVDLGVGHYAAAGGHVAVLRWLIKELGLPASTPSQCRNRTQLHCAVLRDRVEVVRWLLEEGGVKVTELDGRGDTPLILAARIGRLEVVRYLVSNNLCNLEDRCAVTEDNALTLAACNGHLAVVEYLVSEAKADLKARNKYGDTPWLRAMHAFSSPIVPRWLLAHGIDPAERDKDGNSALILAAGNGLLPLVKLAVTEAGASVQETDLDGSTPLLVAVRWGHIPVVRWLLQHGASLQEKNRFGATPVLMAAVGGQLPMLRWLLRHGLSVDIRDLKGCNPLHMAAYFGHIELASFLIFSCGLSPQSRDNERNTPLVIAAHQGHLQLVRWLLQQGLSALTESNRFGENALHGACLGGHLDVCKFLYELMPDIVHVPDTGGNTAIHFVAANQLAMSSGLLHWLVKELHVPASSKNKAGSTPLLLAAHEGRLDTVKWLLQEGGSSIKETNLDRNTAFLLAANKGHVDLMKFLLQAGAKASETNKYQDTALHAAAKGGSVAAAMFLVQECKLDLSSRCEGGATPLMTTCINGHLHVVQWLIEQGANRLDRDDKGCTPLLYAAHDGRLDVVKYLLSQGAKVTERDNTDVTALLLATAKGHLDVVKYLLQTAGSKITERSSFGWNAALTAAIFGHLDLLRWLLSEGGGSLDDKDLKGNGLLHAAADQGHLELVKALVEEYKMNVHERNVGGLSPLLLATISGRAPVVTYLLANGASPLEKDTFSNTVTHAAMVSGDPNTVKAVLLGGAPAQERNGNGDTPIEFAVRQGKKNRRDLVRAVTEAEFLLAVKAGDLEAVKRLHEQEGHAILDATDGADHAAVDLAAGHPAVVEYLKRELAAVRERILSPSRLDPFRVGLLLLAAFALAAVPRNST